MPAPFTAAAIDRLIRVLTQIREQCLSMERKFVREIEQTDPEYRISARNLLHYLALRQHDLRELQRDLSFHGLSSLGRMEANTLAGVDAVLAILHKLGGRLMARAPEHVPQVDFATGPAILNRNTQELLGPPPHDRTVRIMVTMPSEAATDYIAGRFEDGLRLFRQALDSTSKESLAAPPSITTSAASYMRRVMKLRPSVL